MGTAGIIFSNLNTATINQLTADRTVAAIPFACRYRLIDFALSNMVNAEIANINVITNYNYRSLMEHIGSGKDWDLARHGAGIRIVSPYQNARKVGTKLYSSHLDALVDVAPIIDDIHEQNVICCDSDVVLNMDLSEVIAFHEEKNADITLVTVPADRALLSRGIYGSLSTDENGKITDILRGAAYDEGHPEMWINMFVIKSNYLRLILAEAAAHGFTSFTRDILMRKTQSKNYYCYPYRGTYACVADFKDYYAKSMQLLTDRELRAGLLAVKNRPIFTNVHNTAPVRYGESAKVTDSLIADDCVIDGTVENCILFRGVHIGKGSVVRNSILLGKGYVGKNVTLDAVVTDKDVLISDGVHLAGCAELPFYVPKKKRL